MKFALVIILLALNALPAHAWNGRGHRVVALIAERHMTHAALAAVHELLSVEGKDSMSEVATWADEVKRRGTTAEPSHSVRLGLDGARYNEATDCPPPACPVSSIRDAINTLKNGRQPQRQIVALKYLVHFVGDIHQPLHATTAGDGQSIVLGGKKSSLHKTWDGLIIGSQPGDDRAFAERIDNEGAAAFSSSLDPAIWAMEGRDIAEQWILVGALAQVTKQPKILPDDYPERYWPIARDCLKKAGNRLAAVLNHIYSAPRS